MKNKSDLKGTIKTLLTDLKIAGIIVRFIRCDNAGKQMAMKNHSNIKSFVINFEFSGPRTPERNGNLWKKLQTFYGRILSMLNRPGLED
jgi:hypothetical protein